MALSDSTIVRSWNIWPRNGFLDCSGTRCRASAWKSFSFASSMVCKSWSPRCDPCYPGLPWPTTASSRDCAESLLKLFLKAEIRNVFR